MNEPFGRSIIIQQSRCMGRWLDRIRLQIANAVLASDQPTNQICALLSEPLPVVLVPDPERLWQPRIHRSRSEPVRTWSEPGGQYSGAPSRRTPLTTAFGANVDDRP